MRKSIAFIILAAFLANTCVPPSYAQTVLDLPVPGTAVNLSQAFEPVLVKGINVHPENAMMFDFIVDPGQGSLDRDAVTAEFTKLVKYFMAALAVPEDDLWVNLSPYEKDRIVPEALGQTEMGRDMLAQDYLLKQITASLIDPRDELGKKFWDRIYKEAFEKYGTTDIPVDTFNKVWIMPDKAVVYENKGKAVVLESSLKVMLETDYLAMDHNGVGADLVSARGQADIKSAPTQELTQDILREIVIPVLEKEINTGKSFTQLRQVYNSLILAHWFRTNFKKSVLHKVYADRSRIKGVDVDDKEISKKIYAQYVESFKKGVYDYVKEEYDPSTQELIPRKYFSGGETFNSAALDAAMITTADASQADKFSRDMGGRALVVTASFQDLLKENPAVREYRPKNNRPVITHIPAEEWQRFGDGNESFQVLYGRLSEDFPWVATHTSYQRLNVDFEITSRIIDLYEQGKGRSRNDPIVVLDWGCGEGTAVTELLDIVKILGRKYPGLNVRVIGYSRDFYPSWSTIPRDVDMVVDEAKYLMEDLQYLGVKHVDLVFSRLGITHWLHENKFVVLEHLKQLGQMLRPGGDMRMDVYGDITDLEYAGIGLASAGLVRSGATYGLRVERIVPMASVPEYQGAGRFQTVDNAEAFNVKSEEVVVDLKNQTLVVEGREGVLIGESMNLIFRDGNIVYRVMKRLPREDEEDRFEIAQEIEQGMRLAAGKGYGPTVLGTGYTGNDPKNGRFYIAVEFLPGKDLQEDPSFPRDRFKAFITAMINDGIFIHDFTPEQFIYDKGTGEFKLADSEKTRPVIAYYGFVDSVFRSMFDYLQPQRKWDPLGLPGLCDDVLAQMDELLQRTRESGSGGRMSSDKAQADPRLALSVGPGGYAQLKEKLLNMIVQAGYATPEEMVRGSLGANKMLGAGSQNAVFHIPGIEDICLRIVQEKEFQEDGRGLEVLKNVMPGYNVGQPIARIGNVSILLTQRGEPAGASGDNIGERYGNDPLLVEAHYADYLKAVADFPQSSYDRFARLYQDIQAAGHDIDPDPTNLMVDAREQDFNVVDLLSREAVGQTNFADLLLMLVDVYYLGRQYPLVENVPGPLRTAIVSITQKLMKAFRTTDEMLSGFSHYVDLHYSLASDVPPGSFFNVIYGGSLDRIRSQDKVDAAETEVDLEDFDLAGPDILSKAGQSTIYFSKDEVLKVFNTKLPIPGTTRYVEVTDEHVAAMVQVIRQVHDMLAVRGNEDDVQLEVPKLVRIKGGRLALLSRRIIGQEPSLSSISGAGALLEHVDFMVKMKDFIKRVQSFTAGLYDHRRNYANYLKEEAAGKIYDIDPIHMGVLVERMELIKVRQVLNSIRGIDEELSLFKRTVFASLQDVNDLEQTLREASPLAGKAADALKAIYILENDQEDIRKASYQALNQASAQGNIDAGRVMKELEPLVAEFGTRRLFEELVSVGGSRRGVDRSQSTLPEGQGAWDKTSAMQGNAFKVKDLALEQVVRLKNAVMVDMNKSYPVKSREKYEIGLATCLAVIAFDQQGKAVRLDHLTTGDEFVPMRFRSHFADLLNGGYKFLIVRGPQETDVGYFRFQERALSGVEKVLKDNEVPFYTHRSEHYSKFDANSDFPTVMVELEEGHKVRALYYTGLMDRTLLAAEEISLDASEQAADENKSLEAKTEKIISGPGFKNLRFRRANANDVLFSFLNPEGPVKRGIFADVQERTKALTSEEIIRAMDDVLKLPMAEIGLHDIKRSDREPITMRELFLRPTQGANDLYQGILTRLFVYGSDEQILRHEQDAEDGSLVRGFVGQLYLSMLAVEAMGSGDVLVFTPEDADIRSPYLKYLLSGRVMEDGEIIETCLKDFLSFADMLLDMLRPGLDLHRDQESVLKDLRAAWDGPGKEKVKGSIVNYIRLIRSLEMNSPAWARAFAARKSLLYDKDLMDFDLLFEQKGPASKDTIRRLRSALIDTGEKTEQLFPHLDILKQIVEEKAPSDPAGMDAAAVQGGIDFKAQNMNVEIQGEGADFPLPENMRDIDLNNIEGLIPVIINVTPVPSMSAYLFASN
jgi:hypothetical protein